MGSPERLLPEMNNMGRLSFLNSAIAQAKADDNFEAVVILQKIRRILIRVYKLQGIEF